MIETFGATFFGVVASFLLWLLGNWWIRRRIDSKSRADILVEIEGEITLNMAMIEALKGGTRKMLAAGNIPVALPGRLRLSAYNYAVSSGELRLLSRQSRVNLSTAAYLSESANKFIENTEFLLSIWQFKPQDQALRLAKIRLDGLIEDLEEHGKEMKRILDALQSENSVKKAKK